MNSIRRSVPLGLLVLALSAAAVGCSSNGDDTTAPTTTSAAAAVDASTWADAQAAADAFNASIADLSGEIRTVWDDLYGRFDAISAGVANGVPTQAATSEWPAFKSDAADLGTAIDGDAAQLGQDVVDAWNRFAAALDVLDTRF
jgi:ABC-type glycerol-3-phosphate transport system substrate-binding protein